MEKTPCGAVKAEYGLGVGMKANINYCWRLIATGGCFLVFGIGALILSAVIFPVMQIISGPKKATHARWVVSKVFGIFLWLMQTTGVIRLEVIGADKLRNCRNVLVLANHPTLIDVVALISLMPNASCVVKRALWRNPFVWGGVRAANYISNLEPEALVQDCAADMKTGQPLLIFPEGTRSVPGRPLKFRRGAAYIAINSDVPILPVLIRCVPPTLTKGEKWYKIPKEQAHLLIEVKDVVNVNQLMALGDPPAIAARKLTLSLEKYFSQELSTNGKSAP
jgi:1-acyl-sn-glycerol-3-phosphate acyltransferase